MEVYFPYIAVSTLTSFLGGITYKYYNNEIVDIKETKETNIISDNEETNIISDNEEANIISDNEEANIISVNEENEENSIEGNYNIIEDKLEKIIIEEVKELNENKNNVDKILEERNNNKYLGRTRNQKMENMRRICREECNIVINSNNKKSKNRLMKLIREYENKGHKEFVCNNRR